MVLTFANFCKHTSVVDYVTRTIEKLFPEEDLPQWVNAEEFYEDLIGDLYEAIYESLTRNEKRYTLPVSCLIPFAASTVDTGASSIVNEIEQTKLIEKDILAAWNSRTPSKGKRTKGKSKSKK